MKNYIKTYPTLSKKICKQLIEVYDKNSDMLAKPGVTSVPDREGGQFGSINPWLKRCMEFGFLEYEKVDRHKYAMLDMHITKGVTERVWKYAEEFPHTFKRVFDSQDLKSTHFMLRKYDKGDYFNWHVDTVSLAHMSRCLSCIIYLNDVEEGGETMFELSTGEEYAVKPETGKMVVFPAHWMYRHKGAIPVSEPKYCVTCFISAY